MKQTRSLCEFTLCPKLPDFTLYSFLITRFGSNCIKSEYDQEIPHCRSTHGTVRKSHRTSNQLSLPHQDNCKNKMIKIMIAWEKSKLQNPEFLKLQSKFAIWPLNIHNIKFKWSLNGHLSLDRQNINQRSYCDLPISAFSG